MQNLEEFEIKLKEIRKEAINNTGKKDYHHMRGISFLGNAFFALGLLSCYLELYLLSMFLIAFSMMVKWLLMHHIGHGGYNRLEGIPHKFHSKYYAQGWRRYIDWFDWIKPEAWNYEHNVLHHSFTGELEDPDLVEENLSWLAQAKAPLPLKFLLLVFFAATWKFTYYSARTLSFERHANKEDEIDFSNFLDLRKKKQRVMWLELFLPYVLYNFILVPALLEFMISGMGSAYLICRIGAEVIHNIHTFIIIVPNHSGEDIHRFDNVDNSRRSGAEFYVRQILGSANYATGNEWLDLSQMYLNYQIEHHLFPNLSMLQYRRIQPKVKALCIEHDIPYIQESVWARLFKMSLIATGVKKMIKKEGANVVGYKVIQATSDI